MLDDARKAAADGAESDRRLKNPLQNSLPAGNKADRPPRIDRWDFAFRQRRTRRSCRGRAATTPSPLVGEGWGGGSGGCGNAMPPLATPPPAPSPAETASTRVSVNELSDRSRVDPTSIGGRG